MEGVRLILEGAGEDPNREGLLDTPKRVANMFEELLQGMELNSKELMSKTFSCANADVVLEKDIFFYSLCEHHMLPFYGSVHIAYLPDEKVVGLSKLARTVEVFARRLQIQERMTEQIADDIMQYLKPKGVLVMVEAEHMCMTMRGVKKPGTKTVTLAARGIYKTDRSMREETLSYLRV